MAIATRQVEVDWVGSLASGTGTLSPSSRAFSPLPVTWASRTERPDGKTSPEELVAAAHASCYAMALALVLGENKTPAARITIAGSCTLDEIDGAPRITTSDLNVRASVPGLTPQSFEELVERAGILCPVSNALRGNIQIRVECELEQ